MKPRRDGERGLSIMEAVVIATITALLALLLLPLLPRSSGGALDVAERSVSTLDAMRAEREFRTLVRAVSARDPAEGAGPLVAGDTSGAVLYPNLQYPVACAEAGAPTVRLIIARGSLICVGQSGQRILLRWPEGATAALAYSGDGAAWRTSWSETQRAPFVRFELRHGDRVVTSWVERTFGNPP